MVNKKIAAKADFTLRDLRELDGADRAAMSMKIHTTAWSAVFENGIAQRGRSIRSIFNL
jgi:hypothetical protein